MSDTMERFRSSLHAVSKAFGKMKSEISYLLPSDSSSSAEHAIDAAMVGFAAPTLFLKFFILQSTYLQIPT